MSEPKANATQTLSSSETTQPITSPPPSQDKPMVKPFIEAPQGEGIRNQPLGSEALGNPVGCGPDHFGKWLMACARC